ncbi:hypothetical protein ACNUDN_26985 [Mycobacterium sp. smrl_JER01]|uniref:hypothetical protein n=1 Tax=Mycobacterium sp. smrl_JER01 TaxID=3402633 RepID=UPI003AD64C9D
MGLVIRLLELLLLLVPLIGAGYAAFLGVNALRRRQTDALPPTEQAPQVADPAAAKRRALGRAVEVHDRTDTRWLEYELDVAKLLDYPMMTDLRDPLTERFHRAKLRADFMRPADISDLIDDPDGTREYLDAVQEYATAFDIAEAEALRRRRSGFVVEDQERLARAQRLLRVAADSAATQQERDRAYRLAQRELDGLLVLPERARAELERGIKGELD